MGQAGRKSILSELVSPTERPVRPAMHALLLAGVYAVFSIAYVLSSTWLATKLAANDVGALARIEQIKGVCFMIASAALIFGLAWMYLHLLHRQDAELRRHREALLGAERRAVAGMLASSVAHDINNILMICDFNLTLLSGSGCADDERRESVAQLQRAKSELKSLATRLSGAAGRDARDQPQDRDLVAVVRECLDFIRLHARIRQCQVELRAPERLPARVRESMLRHMLFNLVLNAAQAAGDRGRIEVVVRQDGGMAVIEVHDSGPGVPPAERAHIFEPLYTTKQEGTGLGLLTVSSGAIAHGGTVEVGDSPMGGACFRVALPAAGNAPAA